MKALTLILTFSIMVALFSHATPTLITQPQMNISSMVNHTQLHTNVCAYHINVKTSCNSPAYTTDAISISIGDANGNEVLAQQMENPGMLESCMENRYIIVGHCIGKICEMSLTRVGSDGWMPETVIVSHGDYPPITFNFNYFIPNDQRSGFNYCPNII